MAPNTPDWQIPVNMGAIDRTIRIVLGLAIIALVFVGPQSNWGLLGFVPLLTGIAGYCPLYAMVDFSTVGTPHRITHA